MGRGLRWMWGIALLLGDAKDVEDDGSNETGVRCLEIFGI